MNKKRLTLDKTQLQHFNFQTNLSQSDDNVKQQQQQQPVGCCGIFSVAYYQPYFNVTQYDVFQRLQSALIPIRNDFLQLTQNNPDLWGPIWITSSLVLLIAATGNFNMYLNSTNKSGVEYNFEYIPVAACLLYLVAFGTPVLLALLMKLFGSEISLFQTICLYGYSMATLIPISIICTLPFAWLQWLLIVAGFFMSCVFLLLNLKDELAKLETQKRYIITGVVIGMQLVLYLLYKLFFFRMIQENKQV